MGTQEYRANYRVAMQEANAHLAELYREFDELQLRKEQLEEVLGALDPFLSSAAPMTYEAPRPEPVRTEPTRYEFEMTAHVAATPAIVHEPIKPAPFAPATEVIVDPIQSRINRALGLAVA
jgi:hypothetical protein